MDDGVLFQRFDLCLVLEIGDSFKIEVIKAVRQLAVTYPSKHRTMMNFLATQLREEGPYEVKKDLIEALAMLMTESSSVSQKKKKNTQSRVYIYVKRCVSCFHH